MVVQGQASAAAASVAIPAHQPGDLIFVFARRASNSSATIPSAGGTVPTWLTAQSLGANTLALTTVYAVATASNHTTGTFTNASHIAVLVLRPDSGKALSVVGSSTGNANNTTTLVYPALTLTKTDGTSWGVRCGTKSVASTPVGTAPASWTAQTVQPAGASALMSVHTRASLSANPVADTVSGSTSAAYRAHTVEVAEAAPQALTLDVNDTVAVADSMGLAQGHVMALDDTAALVDDGVFSLHIPMAFADKVGFGELFPSGLIYPGGTRYSDDGDVLYIGDVVPLFLNLDDAVALADSALIEVFVPIPLPLADAVALADLLDIFVGQEIIAADTVPLVDAIVWDAGYVLADTVGLVDSLFLDVPGTVVFDGVDAVALADVLTFVAAYAEPLVDAVPLADALAFAQGHAQALADTVALADSLALAIPITLSFSDSVTLADAGPATNIQRQWLIPIPEEPETLAPVAEQALVLTPAPEGTRELVVAGGSTPSATPLPENTLDITPFAEGEH
jgi:hypothetical protein